MKNSSTIRAEARAALAVNGTYWLYFGGILVLGLVVGVAIAAFIGLFAATAVVAGSLGIAYPATLGEIFSSPAALALTCTVSLAATVLFLYTLGFARWSQSAMELAASRGGLRFGHAFSGWGNGWRMTWIMLVYTTFLQLWSLLLFVPGIIKAFSYALTPFVAIDHPDWGACQCITESRRLMRGNKWRLFKLLFSFIGWLLLVVMLSLVPFVGNIAPYLLEPYLGTAFARFYEDVLDEDESKGRQ